MLEQMDWAGSRTRPANYIEICHTIADSYPDLAHGVQKDALQNAFDAVKGSGPLRFRFEVIENERGRFFAMQDAGTVGLTGSVRFAAEYEDLVEEDRWAKFESFGFTKTDPDAIGARGQGKFVFLAASADHTMAYETLRDDGVYRLGVTRATTTDCPMKHWEEEEAKAELRKLMGIEPLSTIGTRVLIVAPVPLLVGALRNGDFANAIAETWFRRLEKRQADITVGVDGVETMVSPRRPFPLPSRDSERFKVWIREGDVIKAGGKAFRIKRLHVVRQMTGRVPEDMRGVAVTHFGMKIEPLQMQLVDAAVRDSIVGYVEFDRRLDQELRRGENQYPNHYGLNWRRAIPRAIRVYVETQLEEFGHEKLGLGTDRRERRARQKTDAEAWALRELSIAGADLDLLAGRRGRRRQSPDPPPPPPSEKVLGLRFRGLVFPDPDIEPRVNWGMRFERFGLDAFNRSADEVSAVVRVYVFAGDRTLATILDERDVEVAAAGERALVTSVNVVF